MDRTARFSAVAAVEEFLHRAHAEGASDIHIDPTPAGVTVTLRRDGVLEEVDVLPAEWAARLVGRVKTLADLLAYRTDLPQEGRIAADRSGIGCEVRVATYPVLDGERIALRLDAPDTTPAGLDTLGLPAPVLASLARAVAQPEGVILLTGPSGSGKTTTLYACVRHLVAARTRRSIVTIEDPVERRISGVVQSETNPAAGLDFARALRSLLRQDPDVLLLGEIRDRETAEAALEAGLTGHLVLSTIHAGTGPQVFARLLDMGVEPFVLTAAVKGVLAQRLVRRSDGNGGYDGRVPIAQWMPVGPAVRRALLARAGGDALDAAVAEDGGETLRAAAERAMASGLTTQEEVNRVLGRDD
ncbi:MAG: GspE/PulE family protein [Planctomycetota bacterium]|jgi:type II secretory ATPase GspE/PulE/Tfp pilus assembly ATPase PilB-like protein